MPPPDSLPTPDSLGSRGEKIPPVNFRDLLLGAALTAGLTIGGMSLTRPKFGQGTDQRSNTPTGHSAVAVVKKQPQVVLTQTLFDPKATFPIEYQAKTDSDVTQMRVGAKDSPTETTAVAKDTKILIGQPVDGKFPMRVTLEDGGTADLSFTAVSGLTMVGYDAVGGASYASGDWTATPVNVWFNGHRGTFFVLVN
ncbi:MAG: hypothetical protein JNN27_17985 [Planctomycetes bacterium]|nr:hypothetical protein [Planctomycetota bacterium]